MKGKVGRPPGRSANYETQRAHILRTAVDVFAHGGFDAASIRGIAEAAGLSVAAVYHYFPSKEAVMEALIERAASGPGAGIAAAARTGTTVRELLYAFGSGFFLGAAQADAKRLTQVVFVAAHERPAWARMYLERLSDPAESRAAAALAAVMSPAARQRLDPAWLIKQLIGALLSFVIHEEFLRRPGANHPQRQQYLEQVVDVIASGVEAIAGRSNADG